MNETLVIANIDDQGDRIVVRGDNPGRWDYHIICPFKARLKVGDVIEYEPGGINFGWFVKILQQMEEEKRGER